MRPAWIAYRVLRNLGIALTALGLYVLVSFLDGGATPKVGR